MALSTVPSDNMSKSIIDKRWINIRIWIKIYRSSKAAAAPFIDLIIRILIAQMVFRSAIVKAADFEGAIFLARNEYPVDWLDPLTAATIGLSIEFITPILLFIGLFTRPAAAALMALFAVSHFSYLPLDLNLFIIALLFIIIVRGAGAFSLDRLLARGIEDSAFPIAPSIVKLGAVSRRHALPFALLFLRLWLAMTFCIASGFLPEIGQYNIFPHSVFQNLPFTLLMISVISFALGLAIPIMVAGLLFAMSGLEVMGLSSNIPIFSILLLLMLLVLGAGILNIDD